MASFRKRDNGTYQASIYTGRDAKGKQLFEYATRNTLKECKAAAREIEERIAKTNFTDLRRIKTTDWLAEWIELNRNRLSPGTINIYKIYLQAHFIPYFGNIKLDKLNEIHIRRFMAEKLETLSPNTVRKLMSFLNKSLREALKDNNPVKDIQLPGKKKYTPHVVTDEELRQLLTIVKGSVDEIIILLAAWCGLRRGEICALKLNDVFLFS